MTLTSLRRSCRIACRAEKQEARSGVLVSTNVPASLEKYATEQQNHKNCNPCFIRHLTRISTFNVRTLNSEKQLGELISSAIEYNIDVVCIQEHRLYHDDTETKYHKVGQGWVLITASAWKNSINSTIGGVGMLLSPRAFKALNNFEKITKRIIVASFNGNPQTTVISCYSPTNITEEQEITEFYDDQPKTIGFQ